MTYMPDNRNALTPKMEKAYILFHNQNIYAFYLFIDFDFLNVTPYGITRYMMNKFTKKTEG